jgi:hypothetical protein
MSSDDDVIDEILAKNMPGFKKSASKKATDATAKRAEPEASAPDLSRIQEKASEEFIGTPAADAGAIADPGDIILRHMGARTANADAGGKPKRDVRILKVENKDGKKTRAVLDLTSKKKIGEAS